MKKPNKRFALRTYSRFPMQISMTYLGQISTGRAIVQELSRVGCRILVTSQQPMFIGRATVQWVKGLECDLAFKRLPPREADRLQYLLDALLESGSYSGRPSAWLKVKPPLTSSRRAKNLVLARTPSSSSMFYRGTVVFPMLYGHSWSTGRKCEGIRNLWTKSAKVGCPDIIVVPGTQQEW